MARTRRRAFRRLTLLTAMVGALVALREVKLRENQERFGLP